MILRWRTVLLVAGILALPCRARAGCTTRADASAVAKSARLLERYNDKRLRRGPAITCKTSAPPACAGLLCLPYLAGERTPLWDEKACGAFVGIRAQHGVAHFIRAGLEGVCFA